MKSLTYILLFSGITLASATTSRTQTITPITNSTIDTRDFGGSFGGLGHISKIGGCADADYAPCPNADGCCPIGVTCTATKCQIPCTSADIPCGSGCCDTKHVCTADFKCGLPTGGSGGGATGGGATGGGATGGGATGGGATGGGATGGGATGGGTATCKPGQFACQDSEGGCCPNGMQCLPNYKCGTGTGTGGGAGNTTTTGNSTTSTGGSSTGGSSSGGSSTTSTGGSSTGGSSTGGSTGSSTGGDSTTGSGSSSGPSSASNNIRIPTLSSMMLTMTPLLYYLFNQL